MNHEPWPWSWGLLVYIFGACVAYMIIMADNLTSVATATGLLPKDSPLLQPAVLYTALATLITPLCLPQSLGELHVVSVAAFVGFMYVFQGFRVSGFQGFRVPGFQGSRVSVFQGSRVSGFQGKGLIGF